jgi:tellurite resistance protein TerC
MVVILPDDLSIEWPVVLQRFGNFINPLAGNQRTAALRVGLLGAYVGRGIMLLLASLVIRNPWLKLIGALYLIRLAFENLGMPETGEEDQYQQAHASRGFWIIVLNVELADLIFSLDNVVAAVSLSKNLWIVMFGVAIGILTMRFAAGLFSKAVLKEPILKYAAYILVLNIGIQLLLEDLAKVEIPDLIRFAVSLAIIALALLYAHSKTLQKTRPILLWLAQGMENINELINWALVPAQVLFRIVVSPFQWMLRKRSPKKLSSS